MMTLLTGKQHDDDKLFNMISNGFLNSGINQATAVLVYLLSYLKQAAQETVRTAHRSDHTGFEVMLGDMATFTAPEETARLARAFWQ